MLIYITIIFIHLIKLFPLGCTNVTEISYPYLQWSWFYKLNVSNITLTLVSIMFPISLMLLFYFGLDKPYNLYLSVPCIISFMISYIIYRKQRVFGTLWCWFAVFVPLLIVLSNKIL